MFSACLKKQVFQNEDMQRRAADAKNAMPVERVRYDDASNNAKHGKTGTFWYS